jgi:hypothetical protein
MVAAGLDTLPGNINMTIAYLSSEHGQVLQERAYEDIMKSYAGEDPWHGCLVEEKSEFMQAFVKVHFQLVVVNKNGSLCLYRKSSATGPPSTCRSRVRASSQLSTRGRRFQREPLSSW